MLLMNDYIGRPLKYKELIYDLTDDVIYSPASIANHAQESGYILSLDREEIRLQKQRIRIALARLSSYRGFPENGDGLVTIPGQATTVGWLGSRWKQSMTDLKMAAERDED